MKGAGAVEVQRHGFHVDAQNPWRARATPADLRGVEDGEGGDVVLAFDFVDSLMG